MEKIIIGAIVGGMYALSIALYKNASKSTKFTDIQRSVLFLLIIFPPLIIIIYFIILILGTVKHETKSETKKLKKSIKEISNLSEVNNQLESLRNSNLLSESEYLEKKDKIINQINNQVLYNTEEFKNLKSLYENSILTEEEFKQKTNILSQKLNEKEALKEPTRKIVKVNFIKNSYDIKMGSSKEFHILMDDGKGIKIYERKSDKKCYVFDSNKEILLFPNLDSCVDYISQRI